MKFIASLSFSLLSVSFALEHPESFLRSVDDDERSLRAFGAAQCSQKLSVCEAVTGDFAIPAQKMIDFLEAYDGDASDTLIDDFSQLVTLSSQTAFAPLVEKVHTSAKVQTILKTIRSVSSEVKSFEKDEPAGVFAVLIDGVTQLNDALTEVTQLPDNTLEIIIFMLEFTAGLLGTISEGPVAVLVFVLQSIIDFITTFLGGLFTVALFPRADTECQSELMLCSYTKTMMEILPSLFGTIFIAEASA